MKATVKWRDMYGKSRQRTMQVDRNEPNSIIREFVTAGWFRKCDEVKTIKCGRRLYIWAGAARDAFAEF